MLEYLEKGGTSTLNEIITSPTETLHYVVVTKKYLKSKLKYEINFETRQTSTRY